MGAQMVRARLEDEQYIDQIKRHQVVFLEGDALHCVLRMRQMGS
jgi:hypothetical protein